MADFIEWLRPIIENIINTIGYPGIALVMFAENLFPPIPSELVMPFAGFSITEGKMDFTLALVAGTIGALLGAVVLYYIGLVSDEFIVRRFIRRYGRFFMLSEADLDRALGYFDRYGHFIVLFGRLIPIIRSLISLPAGMKRMPMPKFLLWTTIGTLVWNVILTVAGMILAENWDEILGIIRKYELVTVALVAVAVAYFIYTRIRQRRAVPSDQNR